ncbi:MAG: hypothetical protein LBH32_07195 [Dysgonamonadaceae bacterium]|nr:hypothetical protein [Dysgonamonadaceae bacterium]
MKPKTQGGKTKILSLDGRLELNEIRSAGLKERLQEWLKNYCTDLSIKQIPQNGIVFEVR